ncbi:MAG: hypothetical protein H0V66_06465 [Bdellovibrionales bacterium]|nr:hypothetical protein [Bdellovibrionales bacterium]
MKNLIIFLFLVISVSLNLSAQIQTGGGPDEDEITKIISTHEFKKMLKEYDKLLEDANKQWVSCKGKPVESFEDLYTQLALIDTDTILSPKCDSKVTCFYTTKMKASFRYFFAHKNAEAFMKYKEDNISAPIIVKYFFKRSNEE